MTYFLVKQYSEPQYFEYNIKSVEGETLVNRKSEGQQVDNNFYARYTYGNKRESGLRLMHWNKGSSMLDNKMGEIEAVVHQYKPHVLGLSEAN